MVQTISGRPTTELGKVNPEIQHIFNSYRRLISTQLSTDTAQGLGSACRAILADTSINALMVRLVNAVPATTAEELADRLRELSSQIGDTGARFDIEQFIKLTIIRYRNTQVRKYSYISSASELLSALDDTVESPQPLYKCQRIPAFLATILESPESEDVDLLYQLVTMYLSDLIATGRPVGQSEVILQEYLSYESLMEVVRKSLPVLIQTLHKTRQNEKVSTLLDLIKRLSSEASLAGMRLRMEDWTYLEVYDPFSDKTYPGKRSPNLPPHIQVANPADEKERERVLIENLRRGFGAIFTRSTVAVNWLSYGELSSDFQELKEDWRYIYLRDQAASIASRFQHLIPSLQRENEVASTTIRQSGISNAITGFAQLDLMADITRRNDLPDSVRRDFAFVCWVINRLIALGISENLSSVPSFMATYLGGTRGQIERLAKEYVSAS